MPALSIEEAVTGILEGRVRIPAFQRGFVWDADRVAFFMDSLYRGYPFGTLLFWRTKNELRTERDLGPYELPRKDPDYPIDYVLDGQQRLTSVFGVFQTELDEKWAEGWLPVYFDYRATPEAQEPQFEALKAEDVDPERHFPLKVLFDTTAYRAVTKDFDEELALRIDAMQKRFLQATLPVQSFETDSQAEVAIVFERVNRLGIALDAFQLLTAWSWSDDFDLQEQFRELATELEPFGFSEVDADPNLLLRCCAAVIAGDASPNALVSLSGATVRDRFEEIRNGVLGAVDFVRGNLKVETLENLPYSATLVPLAVFFAAKDGTEVGVSATQRGEILRWFWRACYARRYSSGVLRNLKTDIGEMAKLRADGSSALGTFAASVEADFFTDNTFIASVVNTKTFVLTLAQQEPCSFVSGAPIDLGRVLKEYNRNEFHHLYPRSYLKECHEAREINRLSNFAFMSRADNRKLGGRAPSNYREDVDDADEELILEHALCPAVLFEDDYSTFTEARADLLVNAADALINSRDEDFAKD